MDEKEIQSQIDTVIRPSVQNQLNAEADVIGLVARNRVVRIG